MSSEARYDRPLVRLLLVDESESWQLEQRQERLDPCYQSETDVTMEVHKSSSENKQSVKVTVKILVVR